MMELIGTAFGTMSLLVRIGANRELPHTLFRQALLLKYDGSCFAGRDASLTEGSEAPERAHVEDSYPTYMYFLIAPLTSPVLKGLQRTAEEIREMLEGIESTSRLCIGEIMGTLECEDVCHTAHVC
jgi:hypothetical protein